jgi:hypothetical protein
MVDGIGSVGISDVGAGQSIRDLLEYQNAINGALHGDGLNRLGGAPEVVRRGVEGGGASSVINVDPVQVAYSLAEGIGRNMDVYA